MAYIGLIYGVPIGGTLVGVHPTIPWLLHILQMGLKRQTIYSMLVFGSRKRWDRWHSPSPNWQEKCHLYTTYILPSEGLYATYHLLREPETTIDILECYPKTAQPVSPKKEHQNIHKTTTVQNAFKRQVAKKDPPPPKKKTATLPETNIAPENGWLEY